MRLPKLDHVGAWIAWIRAGPFPSEELPTGSTLRATRAT
jgi:hypothetical protein